MCRLLVGQVKKPSTKTRLIRAQFPDALGFFGRFGLCPGLTTKKQLIVEWVGCVVR